MIQDAFDHNPLYKSLRKTPVSVRVSCAVQACRHDGQDANPEHPDSAYRRFIMYLDILYHVHYLGAFTINHGEGCVTLYAFAASPHEAALGVDFVDAAPVQDQEWWHASCNGFSFCSQW
ncbi:hypothetical protein FOMPIDRAFT_1023290 [Fomitopsis schrenkii]|uniref:Uncharacterized protein n=1 Tax=Fomitopsis schrenkii TaxID=2126942 RepID=S8FT66_FOMSC|nr:hypothetical protein FOMPIDRAFT_1023290 [Fomitopsis schrenkii]